MRAGELTFVEGQKIFRQQAPLGDGPIYRTFRWGRDLQIWFTDGRDFRSPNKMKDGPDKTIWGAEQKAWFKKTVSESTATWKVLVSPTPLVGPDRVGKNDNHTGQLLRDLRRSALAVSLGASGDRTGRIRMRSGER
jgi:alkaline phosphatase D